MSLRALVHASELLTGAGVRVRGGRRVTEEDLGRLEDGALVYRTRGQGKREVPGKIEWVGPTSELPRRYARVPRRDLQGRQALIPGLVDCHTHLIFAGNRSGEFAARCGGASYEEIARRGGGIVASVQATRDAPPKELERLAIERLEEAYAYGVRTLEIKSGYGLSAEAELKVLGLIPRLRRRFPAMTLTATFLGAHAFPKDQDRKAYLRSLLEEMLPAVARRKLADTCDVFVDEGYFTPAEARKILGRARQLGLGLKLHADELGNTESAALAAELGALSADHLLCISERGIRRLARSETVAVLLPGTAFTSRRPMHPRASSSTPVPAWRSRPTSTRAPV